HTRSKRDWSSDVCSSDLPRAAPELGQLRLESAGLPLIGELAERIGQRIGRRMVEDDDGTGESRGLRDLRELALELLQLIQPVPRSEERRVGRAGGSRQTA